MYKLTCRSAAGSFKWNLFFRNMEYAKQVAERRSNSGKILDWELSPDGYLFAWGGFDECLYIQPFMFEEDKPNA